METVVAGHTVLWLGQQPLALYLVLLMLRFSRLFVRIIIGRPFVIIRTNRVRVGSVRSRKSARTIGATAAAVFPLFRALPQNEHFADDTLVRTAVVHTSCRYRPAFLAAIRLSILKNAVTSPRDLIERVMAPSGYRAERVLFPFRRATLPGNTSETRA
jgi:hypothetical protein